MRAAMLIAQLETITALKKVTSRTWKRTNKGFKEKQKTVTTLSNGVDVLLLN